jgi:hypothetical protein
LCQRVRNVGAEKVKAVGSGLLKQALPASALVVATDPGKVSHRVWFSTGDAGLLDEPRSVPSLRPGLDEVSASIRRLAGAQMPVVAIAATASFDCSSPLTLARHRQMRALIGPQASARFQLAGSWGWPPAGQTWPRLHATVRDMRTGPGGLHAM